MKIKAVFSKIVYWLKTSEMFARPSKQLPGQWNLFEYYTEPEKELIHKHEEQLKEDKLFLKIEFSENGKFNYDSNLPVNFITNNGDFNWSIAKNYITLIHADDFRKNQEFQFAIEKDVLKILKKDSFGKIILFGFFRKTAGKKIN
ncbi:MAG: lipocalin family protein [Bacteroidota bacterium]